MEKVINITQGLDQKGMAHFFVIYSSYAVINMVKDVDSDIDQAVKKPLDLQASKEHQQYVDLIKKLIGDENKSKTIRLPSPPRTQRVLRWLIAIITLVGVLASVIFSGSIETEPLSAAQLRGTGFIALHDEIDNLYDGQPVLIAFDKSNLTLENFFTDTGKTQDKDNIGNIMLLATGIHDDIFV